MRERYRFKLCGDLRPLQDPVGLHVNNGVQLDRDEFPWDSWWHVQHHEFQRVLLFRKSNRMHCQKHVFLEDGSLQV